MQAVVITGASTGIGRACALTLAAEGFQVFAGVRRDEDGQALLQQAAGRLTPVRIDVTDGESIAAASGLVAGEVGDAGLAGLINNAGTTVPYATEYLPLTVFRRQLEVNLTGHLAVIQAFLPLLRRATGRIVNVSSVVGKVGVPLMAGHVAAKHGLEALSDSLRIELGWSGMHVAVVEPGAITTTMRDKLERDAEATVRSLPDADGRPRYGERVKALATTISRKAADGLPPEAAVRAVVHALTSRRPRTRYAVGADAKLLLTMRRLLPDRMMDRLIQRTLGLGRTSAPNRPDLTPADGEAHAARDADPSMGSTRAPE